MDFKAGINTQTYEHYIDFASQYGLEYIILDEGWSKPSDLFQINPEMNMEELFAYARQKNVGIILWVVWNALENRMSDALDQFVRWGAKGIKVNFMQRDDQKMVNYYETVGLAFKWLNRRSQKRSYTWEQFKRYLAQYPLPKPKLYYNLYTPAPSGLAPTA